MLTRANKPSPVWCALLGVLFTAAFARPAAALTVEVSPPYLQSVSVGTLTTVVDSAGAASTVGGPAWQLRGPAGVQTGLAGSLSTGLVSTTAPGSGLAAWFQGSAVARFQGAADADVRSAASALASGSSGIAQVRAQAGFAQQTLMPIFSGGQLQRPYSFEQLWSTGSAGAGLLASYVLELDLPTAQRVAAGEVPIRVGLTLQGRIDAGDPAIISFSSGAVDLQVRSYGSYLDPSTWEETSLHVDQNGSFSTTLWVQPRRLDLDDFGTGVNCLQAQGQPAYGWMTCRTFGVVHLNLSVLALNATVEASLQGRWEVDPGVQLLDGSIAGWGTAPVDPLLLQPVPEPGSAALLLLGVAGLGGLGRLGRWRAGRATAAGRGGCFSVARSHPG